MKVFVLVKFVDYEDSYIKGVVLTEKVASDWTQDQIQKFASKDFERLKRSRENSEEDPSGFIEEEETDFDDDLLIGEG